MPTWMFNEGSTAHRGVWHVVDEVEDQVVPERVVEHTVQPIFKYHKSPCPLVYGEEGKEVFDYNLRRYVRVKDCVCSLKTQEVSVVVGKYNVTHVYPEHHVMRGDAICGQVSMRTGGLRYASYRPAHVKDGGIYVVTSGVIKPMVWGGDIPIGPYCSRCLKKSEVE